MVNLNELIIDGSIMCLFIDYDYDYIAFTSEGRLHLSNFPPPYATSYPDCDDDGEYHLLRGVVYKIPLNF